MTPVILSIGGGKGGTGKSTLALCLSIQLASRGKRVILADLDFGGANLHTMLKVKGEGPSLVQFLYEPGPKRGLASYLLSTPFSNLDFLSGNGFQPGIANMEFARKQKLVRGLKGLNSDFIVCDLGAGSHYNVVDFFLLADKGILLLTPEATAILNGYEFLKNCVFRKISRAFSRNDDVKQIIQDFKNHRSGLGNSIQELIHLVEQHHPQDSGRMALLCRNFRPAMLLNREIPKDNTLGEKLNALSERHLNVRIDYLGALPEEPALKKGASALMSSPKETLFKKKLGEVARYLEGLLQLEEKEEVIK